VSDAACAGIAIDLVIETHFHADFLSGHLELAAATGAEIAYSSFSRSATHRATRRSRSASWCGNTLTMPNRMRY
jgi:glyoxylase-like metal-dependent hydrolase (beta-lactamase superfamily II)